VADGRLQERRELQEDGQRPGLRLGERQHRDEVRQQRRQESRVHVVHGVGGGGDQNLPGLKAPARSGGRRRLVNAQGGPGGWQHRGIILAGGRRRMAYNYTLPGALPEAFSFYRATN